MEGMIIDVKDTKGGALPWCDTGCMLVLGTSADQTTRLAVVVVAVEEAHKLESRSVESAA